ncbi:ABC transporter ATP-binding protein [Streptacidiphilus pinicola]|uniref:ABC transporter ATP-binding protein n=1 Tax=Streptacidiphilus pinicola TaxID=2219663 RepID=A0A2X0K523_9ACTN|nr:ATP-binding cassette domain-containing protein [Streptacidiphilus pinicola]RAG82659.1 ABC transporter ATP-binding protein [Streptacidiphilus pinicola]
MRIEARGLAVRLRDGRELLSGVDVAVAPGAMLAIAGPSGAGKTTLLEELATGHPAGTIGFVPQDDIVHLDLPLARTLGYAARLQLPAGSPRAEVEAAVARVLDALGLEQLAGQRVGSLSGGERKRASIAVELLTRPRALFLDEPTSGLDPAAAARLLGVLRELTGSGTTVVLTSHNPSDLAHADEVAFLMGGRLLYQGPSAQLPAAFGVISIEEVYGVDPATVVPVTAAEPTTREPVEESAPGAAFAPVGAVRQWWLLTRRSTAILTHNRLSAAVAVGSPLMIAVMFAMLFRPHAFAPGSDNPGSSAMIMFWIAFGAFFFGLTYGLLQICTELPIVRRERRTVLRLGPYLASKLTLLLPVLAAANALLLLVLRATDRLPGAAASVYGSLFVTTLLASASALTLGLLASAAVSDPGQATLMLPLLCFPQVLFSGAFVPVPQMGAVGSGLSWAMTNRWAYEALGRGIGLDTLWAHGSSPLGPPLLASYGRTFTGSAAEGWAWLGGYGLLFLAGAWLVLARKCRRTGR